MSTRAPNLFEQQEANRERSRWLVVGFIAFFAWVGFGGDVAFLLLTRDAGGSYQHTVPFIGIVTTLVAGGICWYSWRSGPQKVLWATGAWEIIEAVTPEQRQYVNVVEEMAIASGLRPVAKALGSASGTTQMRGRGSPEAMAISSTTLTYWRCSGVAASMISHAPVAHSTRCGP